jgi:hypothetical protein
MDGLDKIKGQFKNSGLQEPGGMYTGDQQYAYYELNMQFVWAYHNEIAMLNSKDPICRFLRKNDYYNGPYADTSPYDAVIQSEKNESLVEKYGRRYTTGIIMDEKGNAVGVKPVPYVSKLCTHHFNAGAQDVFLISEEVKRNAKNLALHSSDIKLAISAGNLQNGFAVIFKDEFDSFMNNEASKIDHVAPRR